MSLALRGVFCRRIILTAAALRSFRRASLHTSFRFCSENKNGDLHKSSSSALGALSRYDIPLTEPNMGSPRPMHDPRACDALASLSFFPVSHIRNIAVVAHVDHGKTTLTDAILRRTGVLRGPLGTYTDRLAVERERGITVKAQTCSLFIRDSVSREEYLLNLIDTPGHVDFQYEVSRSLAASEAALLLIDVAQGIEAQTMAHLHAAIDRNLEIIPVLTKLDAVLDDVPVEHVIKEIEDSTGLLRREIILTSAKAQRGIEALLDAIIKRVPPPPGQTGLSDIKQLPPHVPGSAERTEMEEKLIPLRALIFDSWTEECSGGLRSSSSSLNNNYPNSFNSSSSSSSSAAAAVSSSSSSLISSSQQRKGPSRGSADDGLTVTCLVRIIDGTLTARTNVYFYHAAQRHEVREVGIIHPELRPTAALTAGMVGYVIFSPLRPDSLAVGETIYTLPTKKYTRAEFIPISGFKRVQPVVFAGFYPDEGEYITQLRDAVDKLRVNDPSVTINSLDCPALGAGLQLGFLGMLHLQVFQERLFGEFGQKVLVTPPQVQYRCRETNSENFISSPNSNSSSNSSVSVNNTEGTKLLNVHNWRWPHEGVTCYLEPYVHATIITPRDYFNLIDAEARRRFRGEPLDTRIIDDARVVIRYKMPLADLVRGFFNIVKSLSHGYASLDYDDPFYEEADLVKVDIVVQKAKVSALSVICARHEAQDVGRRIVSSLKSNITRSAVDIPLQAVIGGKIIARETVRAYKKDVTAKIHAGDISRKQKKWNDQKKGKERMARRTVGSVTLDQSVLAAAMGAVSL